MNSYVDRELVKPSLLLNVTDDVLHSTYLLYLVAAVETKVAVSLNSYQCSTSPANRAVSASLERQRRKSFGREDAVTFFPAFSFEPLLAPLMVDFALPPIGQGR